MAKNFAVLRARMSPASEARTEAKAQAMFACKNKLASVVVVWSRKNAGTQGQERYFAGSLRCGANHLG